MCIRDSGNDDQVVVYVGGNESWRTNSSGIVMQTGTEIYNSNGTVAVPSYSFSNDTNTGFYLFSDGQLGVAAGGINVATFSPSGISGNILANAGSIGADELASNSVTNAKIANDAVDANKIADNSVTEDHIELGGDGHWDFAVGADNNLDFRFNGTVVFSISSSGALIASNDITAFGTP